MLSLNFIDGKVFIEFRSFSSIIYLIGKIILNSEMMPNSSECICTCNNSTCHAISIMLYFHDVYQIRLCLLVAQVEKENVLSHKTKCITLTHGLMVYSTVHSPRFCESFK